jgi:hypothetical protein
LFMTMSHERFILLVLTRPNPFLPYSTNCIPVDQMRVEIRYLVDRADGSPSEFESYLMNVEEMITPVGVEKAVKAWLQERILGRNIIVSDLEILVNTVFYILEAEEENKLFKRIGAAAGR